MIHPLEAVKLSPRLVGSDIPEAKFVTGVCASAHCMLVDDQGEVWGCGNNTAGQLGMVSTFPLTQLSIIDVQTPSYGTDRFIRIIGPWTRDAEKVVAVSAGTMFSLFLTDAGYVYSTGYAEYGQLGLGYIGMHIMITSGRKLRPRWEDY